MELILPLIAISGMAGLKMVRDLPYIRKVEDFAEFELAKAICFF